MVLRVNRRQFWCQGCGQVFSEELAFVKKRRLYTQRLAKQIVSEVLGSNIQSVANQTGLSDEQIETMMKDAGDAYLPKAPEPFRYLGIDEIAVVKGQGKYYGVSGEPRDARADYAVTLKDARGQDGSWRIARTIRGKSGSAWDEAERRVLVELAKWDLQDVFRRVNGHEIVDFSWFLNRKGDVIGRRFDHIYASTQLWPGSCEYIHALRTQGLSDHSPIMANFAPKENVT